MSGRRLSKGVLCPVVILSGDCCLGEGGNVLPSFGDSNPSDKLIIARITLNSHLTVTQFDKLQC